MVRGVTSDTQGAPGHHHVPRVCDDHVLLLTGLGRGRVWPGRAGSRLGVRTLTPGCAQLHIGEYQSAKYGPDTQGVFVACPPPHVHMTHDMNTLHQNMIQVTTRTGPVARHAGDSFMRSH